VKEEPMSSHQQADVTDTSSDDTAATGNDVQTRNQVLEALKMRIRELETQTRAVGDEKFKCLICMVSAVASLKLSPSQDHAAIARGHEAIEV
jgi:hypothetical protein